MRNLSENHEVKHLLETPFRPHLPIDVCCWWPNKDEMFAVHSAYWLRRCGHLERWQGRLSMDEASIWVGIRKLNLSPKVSLFALCLCANALGVKANILKS